MTGPETSGLDTHDDAGFSLVEVVVSLALLLVVATAGGLALVTALRYGESNENRVVAAGLAAAQVEAARAAISPAELRPAATTVERGGVTFEVERLLSPTTGCNPDGTRTITVIVSWPGTTGPVHSDTIRACPPVAI